jgi:hypothetical protein
MKGGVPCGNNYASPADWTISDQVITYGGPGDLWGMSWTPGDVNATDFGVAFNAKLSAGLAGVFLQAEIDWIQLVVYFGVDPLPIETQRFDVNIITDRKVKVEWTTGTETNNDHFDIERSKDGQIWQSIGKIAGSGNSSSLHDYSYTDAEPCIGTSYYRLKQLDFNGTAAYSSIKSIYLEPESLVSFAPYMKENSIQFNGSAECDLSIHFCLYDLRGNLIKQTGILEIKKGDCLPEIELNELATGTYIYKTNMNDQTFSGKIFKN